MRQQTLIALTLLTLIAAPQAYGEKNDSVKGGAKQAWSEIKQGSKETWRDVKSGSKKAGKAVKKESKGLWQSIKEAFK